MKSYIRGIVAGLVIAALGLTMVRRQMAAPKRFLAKVAWRAGRQLAPNAVRFTQKHGRRLVRFARRIG